MLPISYKKELEGSKNTVRSSRMGQLSKVQGSGPSKRVVTLRYVKD